MKKKVTDNNIDMWRLYMSMILRHAQVEFQEINVWRNQDPNDSTRRKLIVEIQVDDSSNVKIYCDKCRTMLEATIEVFNTLNDWGLGSNAQLFD